MEPFKLDSLQKVMNILNVCRKFESKVTGIDAFCGSYSVDACSTLGLLALIGNEITLKIYCDDMQLVTKFYKEILEVM